MFGVLLLFICLEKFLPIEICFCLIIYGVFILMSLSSVLLIANNSINFDLKS